VRNLAGGKLTSGGRESLPEETSMGKSKLVLVALGALVLAGCGSTLENNSQTLADSPSVSTQATSISFNRTYIPGRAASYPRTLLNQTEAEFIPIEEVYLPIKEGVNKSNLRYMTEMDIWDLSATINTNTIPSVIFQGTYATNNISYNIQVPVNLQNPSFGTFTLSASGEATRYCGFFCSATFRFEVFDNYLKFIGFTLTGTFR
jgi:hypothetical protein